MRCLGAFDCEIPDNVLFVLKRCKVFGTQNCVDGYADSASVTGVEVRGDVMLVDCTPGVGYGG